MVLFLILLDACNNRGGPLNNEVLEAIALVEVGIHKLFHCFARQPTLLAFLVEFSLLLVDVIDEIAQLAKRKHSLVR